MGAGRLPFFVRALRYWNLVLWRVFFGKSFACFSRGTKISERILKFPKFCAFRKSRGIKISEILVVRVG